MTYKDLSDVITQNFTDLIKRTSDLSMLLNLLLQRGVIGDFERGDIVGLTSEHRQKEKLWDILKSKGEEDVPTIIACLKETKCAKSVAELFEQYLKSKSNQTVQNEEQNGMISSDDFVVKDVHVVHIVDLVHDNINQGVWTVIKNTRSFLPQGMRNEIGENSIMKQDMRKSFEVWIKKTPKEQRLFSKIVDAFKKEAIDIAELLEAHQGDWKKLG